MTSRHLLDDSLIDDSDNELHCKFTSPNKDFDKIGNSIKPRSCYFCMPKAGFSPGEFVRVERNLSKQHLPFLIVTIGVNFDSYFAAMFLVV